MTYTGYQSIRPGTAPFLQVEGVLEFLDSVQATAGAPVKHRVIKSLRDTAIKLADVRAKYAQIAESTQAALDDASAKYAAGKISAAALVAQATSTAAAQAVVPEARRLAEAAITALNRRALAEARQIGDAWLVPLKAKADVILAEANTVADEMGIAPTEATPGVRRLESLWSPTRSELEDNMELRHQWERLDSLLADLDDVHYIADTLRNAGLVDAVEGREYGEDYRWRQSHRLVGRPDEVREFFLANRAMAEPGLFTATELAETPLPNVRQQGIDRYNHHVLNEAS